MQHLEGVLSLPLPVGPMPRDLSKVIESPRRYSLSNLPRSITWSEVAQMLLKVDRRSVVGKRDYPAAIFAGLLRTPAKPDYSRTHMGIRN